MTNQFWMLLEEFLKMKSTFPDALHIKASMTIISIDNIRVSWWNAFLMKVVTKLKLCMHIYQYSIFNWPTLILFKCINTRLVLSNFSLRFTRIMNLMFSLRDPCYHRSLNSTRCLLYKTIKWNCLSGEITKT